MSIEGMSDAEVSLLTPEERAALEDTTTDAAQIDDAEKKAALAAEGDVIDDEEEAVEAAAAGDAGEAEPADAKVATDKAKAESTAKVDHAVDAEAKDRGFVLNMPTGEARDYDAEAAATVKKYEEGELEEATYHKIMRDISVAQSQFVNAEAINKAVQDGIWAHEQKRFFKTHGQYKQGSLLYAGLMQAVLLEGQIDGVDDLTGDELLERSHKRVMMEYGQNPPGATVVKDDTPPKKAGEDKARAMAPKTLGEIPAADLPDVGGDRFAHLDKLTGIPLENELAKFGSADEEAYLRTRA
jgi:hypothetical protein